jgi:hypothetical protein
MGRVSISTIPMQAEVAAAERVLRYNFLVFETPVKINDLYKMPQ